MLNCTDMLENDGNVFCSPVSIVHNSVCGRISKEAARVYIGSFQKKKKDNKVTHTTVKKIIEQWDHVNRKFSSLPVVFYCSAEKTNLLKMTYH